jgi:hypothetical protein
MREVTLEQVLLVVVLIEAITENIKWVTDEKISKDKIIALSMAMIVCAFARFSLFDMVGWSLTIPFLPEELSLSLGFFAGTLLSGIAVSRGANVVHDLFKFVNFPKLGLANPN